MARHIQKLFAPVDICWLAVFRILFGVVMLVEVGRYFVYGWVDALGGMPFTFSYYGFEWVRPWSVQGMHLHFGVLGLAAACVALGFCYRFMVTVFFLGFTYVFLLDETYYLNHFYLICLISFLMIFLPAHRKWSVDAWLRPALRSEVAPFWTLLLMRFQIGVPYFFGGVAKLSSDWLHGEPMRKWLGERMHMPVIGTYGREEWFVYAFTYGGLLLDLLIVPCLLWRRTRVPAFCAAAAFHLMNSQLFQIGIFPWLMLGASLIFFPPDTIRHALRKIRLVAELPAGGREQAPSPTWWRMPFVAALALYMAVQTLMPFRHFLYPYDVHWSEEGHRFSWHMKLRTKTGRVLFALHSPSIGKRWTIDPLDTPRDSSFRKMATHPDMILQYAHHLANLKRSEGYPDIEVRARALVSLNGRPPQDLVNPYTDLAKEKRTLAHWTWILPLTEPLPAPTSPRPQTDMATASSEWFNRVPMPSATGL